MRVLVVMQPKDERTSLAGRIAELGIEAVEAGDPREALAALQRTDDVTAVLTGWALANGSGLELLRSVRADARWRELPVVMVTGAEELGQVTQALDAGASEYLMKPYDAQSLLEKLLILGVDPERRAAA
jgi:two-component system chemotaxis response regulator CheY